MRKGSVQLRLSAAALAFFTGFTGFSGVAGAQQATDSALVAKARAIHDRVMALDTHVDIDPRNFTTEHPNYADRLNTQVNLPKMFEGGLDAVFFSIFVGQGPLTPEGYQRAYDADMEKFAAVHRLAEQLAPDKIEIAYRADDVAKIAAKGKKVALMGVENAYGIGTDITNIRKFYDQGARYMSLAHNGLEHGRARRRVAVPRVVAVRQGGRGRAQQARDHDRHLASVERIDDADAGAHEGADHRVALGRSRVVRREPQPR